jgi:hypothetical protein
MRNRYRLRGDIGTGVEFSGERFNHPAFTAALRQKRSITNVRLDEKAQEDGIGPARNADGYFQQGRRQK